MKDIEWRVLLWSVVAIVFGAGPLLIRLMDWAAWGVFTLIVYPVLLFLGCISLWRLKTNTPWWSPFTSLHSAVVLLVSWGLIWSAEIVGIIAISDLTGFMTKIFRVWTGNSAVAFLAIAAAYLVQGYLMISWGTNNGGPTNRSRRFFVAAGSLPLHGAITVATFGWDVSWLYGDPLVLFASHIVLIPLVGLVIADGPWRSPSTEEPAITSS